MGISEHRRQYLLEYNRKWRKTDKGRKYFREYMRKHRGCKSEKSNLDKHILGREYEKLALILLPNSTPSTDIHFDIIWQNKKIEVKVRNFSLKKNGWSFRKNGNMATHYLFFCKNGDKIEKVLFIPKNEFPSGINVCKISKWDKYKFSI